mgnify:CR=1 FL=1
MDDAAFEEYLQTCWEYTNTRQAELNAQFDLDSCTSFDCDDPDSGITFLKGKKAIFQANVQLVGTFSGSAGVWQWAWAHGDDLAPEAQREQAEGFKELESILQMGFCAADNCEIDEEMAWDIAAIACHFKKADGIFGMPVGDDYLQMMILTDPEPLASPE